VVLLHRFLDEAQHTLSITIKYFFVYEGMGMDAHRPLKMCGFFFAGFLTTLIYPRLGGRQKDIWKRA
jgi:hypothetical protein